MRLPLLSLLLLLLLPPPLLLLLLPLPSLLPRLKRASRTARTLLEISALNVSESNRLPSLLLSASKAILNLGICVKFAASFNTRSNDANAKPPIASSYANVRAVFLNTSLWFGFLSTRRMATGYTSFNTLNVPSALLAMPSNPPNARALLIKYGGN